MGSSVRAVRKVVCAASVLSLVASGTAFARVCASPGENSALQTRVLQTELMVAALSCNQREKYNAFVRKFSSELTGLGGNLKSYFSRAHGGRGAPEMNSLVTNLANEASQRAMGYQGNYCDDTASLFESVLAVQPRELTIFAAGRPHANSHGIASCQAAVTKPGSPGS